MSGGAVAPGRAPIGKASGLFQHIAKFLKGLPGIITLITALLGALTAAHQAGIFNIHRRPSVKAWAIPEVPYGMKSLMGTTDFLYWFKIRVENKSRHTLFGKVVFRAQRPGKVDTDAPHDFRVDKSKKFEGKIDPNITFLTDEIKPGTQLEVAWEVYSTEDREHPLDQDTVYIKLLPDDTVDWNLKNADGEPVPIDFLFAFLTRWTAANDTVTKQYANSLQQAGITTADRLSFARHWFAHAYQALFRGPGGIQIVAPGKTSLAVGQQRIRTSYQVLTEREATPLEAALALGALGRQAFRQARVRMALFVLPRPGEGPIHWSFLLGWSPEITSFQSSQASLPQPVALLWEAVDISDASIRSFEENHTLSTKKLDELIKAYPEILSNINDRGVYVKEDRSLLALEFLRADRWYHFTGQQ